MNGSRLAASASPAAVRAHRRRRTARWRSARYYHSG